MQEAQKHAAWDRLHLQPELAAALALPPWHVTGHCRTSGRAARLEGQLGSGALPQLRLVALLLQMLPQSACQSQQHQPSSRHVGHLQRVWYTTSIRRLVQQQQPEI